MNIAISSKGYHLESPFASMCEDVASIIIVDTDNLHYKAISNHCKDNRQFADESAFQELIDNKVEVFVCGKCGSNMIRDLYHSGIKVYHSGGGSIRNILSAYNKKRLISCLKSNYIHNLKNYTADYSFDSTDKMEVLAGCVPDTIECSTIKG